MVWRAQAKEDGRLDFGSETNASRFRQWCKDNPGKWVRIEEQVPVRTLSQNSYYWVYLEAMSRETGHTPEELHEWAKKRFLAHKVAVVMGEEVELTPSTKTLSKVEFGEYLDRISAETGVPLPDPQAAGYLPH